MRLTLMGVPVTLNIHNRIERMRRLNEEREAREAMAREEAATREAMCGRAAEELCKLLMPLQEVRVVCDENDPEDSGCTVMLTQVGREVGVEYDREGGGVIVAFEALWDEAAREILFHQAGTGKRYELTEAVHVALCAVEARVWGPGECDEGEEGECQ